ncbi:hypothetical protein MMC17_006043 [Xylographa soralifera]|nr:hypothetical protein [Xylographa soralifera]
MRRHRASGTSHARTSTTPISDSLSLIRTFNSDTNPSRPIRPSPLTTSTIRGMPLDMLDRIRSFPLFQSAPDTFLAAIGTHLRPQSHLPRDYILTEGDEAKAMYWLVRGAVAVTSRDGESTYAELKPGAFFGEIGILMGIPRTATILARTKCLLIVLKKEDLAKELPNFPEVERTIMEEAQERLSILDRKKREKIAIGRTETLSGTGRGEKRARESEDADIQMFNDEALRSNGAKYYKKRKSPSPSLVDVAASSALGSGMVNVRQLLKELPLFSDLPSEILHFLGSNARQCTYPPFTDIIRQDSQGREVYFIVRGEVEVIDEKAIGPSFRGLANGSAIKKSRGLQVKARLRQGQYFGEVASLSLAPRRTATVRSVTSVECLLITGDVLAEFWLRCPVPIREQIEKTAKQRLNSTSENDVVMADAPDSTPPIDELAIRERPPKAARKNSVPKLAFDHSKLESPHRPSRIEDRPILEPADPDPYLNVDLDHLRSRSRRSSLAPPIPSEASVETSNNENLPPRTTLVTPRAIKSSDTNPKSKRPKTIPLKPNPIRRGILPDNVLLSIFSQLHLHHLMQLRLISSHWARLLRETSDLLHHLDLSRYNRKITDHTLITKICPFVGQRPRSINISNCFHMTDDGFMALATMCGEKVTSWKMKSVWDVSAPAILEMVKSARDLEEIDLSNCRKVNDNLLAWIIGNVPLPLSSQTENQQSLHGRHTDRATGHPGQQPHPSSSVVGSQRLKKLTLSYCKHVTDRSMLHIGQFARLRLEEMDLTRCTTITDHGFQTWSQQNFTKLTKLCLADCTYLTHNAIVYLTSAAKGLRVLDLSFCCALSDTATEVLALGCPQLTHLNLSFCGSAVSDSSLRSISLHLLELRELSVRGCVRVTGVGVEAVVEGCQKLDAFDVSQCKNLVMWLEMGGVQRVRSGVTFNLIAKGKR